MAKRLVVAVSAVAVMTGSMARAQAECLVSESLTREQQEECLKQARIWDPQWKPEDALRYPMLTGDPQHPHYSLRANGSIPHLTGRYVEYTQFTPGGHTPKFRMDVETVDGQVKKDDNAKIKTNQYEVRGCLSGGRLMAAIGMAASSQCYLVTATLDAAPRFPWRCHLDLGQAESSHGCDNRAQRTFPISERSGRAEPGVYMVLQKKPKGDTIAIAGSNGDSGADFNVLDRVSARPRAEVDALKLFVAFTSHMDNKPDNQELTCPKDAIEEVGGRKICKDPVVFIHDTGRMFGAATRSPVIGHVYSRLRDPNAPNLTVWDRTTVWLDKVGNRPAPACTTNVTPLLTSNYWNPRVSEEGRVFLLERLRAFAPKDAGGRVNDAQVRALYRGARFADHRHTMPEDAFVATFLRKIEEIEAKRCPRADELEKTGVCESCDRQPASKKKGKRATKAKS